MTKTLTKAIIGISFLFLQILYGQTSIDYRITKKYIVAGIKVEGAEDVSPELVRALIGIKENEEIQIPGDELRNAIKRLWEHGLFHDVSVIIDSVHGNKVWLTFKLTKQPLISGFIIKGVSKAEADDIADILDQYKGKSYSEAIKENIRASVLTYFEHKGFLLAKVNVSKHSYDSIRNQIKLKISIDKGLKSRIDRILFYGNKHFSDYRLKAKMKHTKEHFRVWIFRRPSLKELFCGNPYKCEELSLEPTTLLVNTYKYLRRRINPNIFASSQFNEEDYERDKWALLKFYHSKGFRNARIIKDTVEFTYDADVIIKIWISEGNKYYFRNITFVGNTLYPDSILAQRLGIKKGDVYNRELLEKKLYGDPAGFDIASLYMNNGHLFFSATPVEVAIENDSVDVEIRIYEGPKAYIDRVTISGNTKTHDHVIRRELYTDPGEIFSRDDVVRSQRQLAALGYFDPENMQINPKPDPQKGKVDIDYTVSERPSDQVELSAGFGGGMVVGSLGFILNNFSLRELLRGEGWDPIPSGDGQRLTIRAQSNYTYYRSLTFSFTEPWFGGKKPHSFTIAAYVNQITNGKKPDEAGFSEQLTWGGTLSWGFRLHWPDDYFSLFTSLEYQKIKLTNSNFFGFFTDGSTNNLFTEFKIVRNSVDQPIYPRQGSQFTLTTRFTPPYSFLFQPGQFNDPLATSIQDKFKWLEYYKLKFDAEWYLPVSKNRKLVLKSRYSIGYLGFYNNAFKDMPFERFELGGDGLSNFAYYGKEIVSLRGYDPFVLFGTAFHKVSFELRYPVTLSPMSTIYVLAFLDGGMAWTDAANINLLDFKRSAGIGVRFLLPMVGLMGFDFGIGFDKGLLPPERWGDYFKAPYTRVNVVLGFEPY
ncbi:MAG: BamA/TamA family outer membrane protein [Chlorobi bacterium]|nr:BamA/TamA family outer membrane protein [Chlorobiota bacterium]